MLSLWIFIFVISLILLIKGSDWFLASAEKIGLAARISPFIVGVVIVGMGTSFPELISSLAAVIKGVTEIIPANAVGSNIANILLVVGISAVLGRRLTVTKDLIDIDLPLLAVSTVLMLGILWDKQVTFFEALLLMIMYGVYLAYITLHTEEEGRPEEYLGILPSRPERRQLLLVKRGKALIEKVRLMGKDLILLIVGLVVLVVGAKYLIDSVVVLSELLNIGVGVISIVAISLGTSLPELFVSARAALKKKYEMALGTVFGSNVFNALIVLGLPGLFSTLNVDEKTFAIGIPALALATLLFIISGVSRRIHIWEGLFYVSLYILFVVKIFGIF